jgi:hypothetical protein
MREGSYNDIKSGMAIVGPGGEETRAKVDEVLVDESSNIFVGLAIHDGGLLHERRLFLPGERVVAVHDGHVEIDVPLSDLEPYVSPEERIAQMQETYTGDPSGIGDRFA